MKDILITLGIAVVMVALVAVGAYALVWSGERQTEMLELQTSETTLAVIERCVDEARAGMSNAGVATTFDVPDSTKLANCLVRHEVLRDGA